MMMTYEFTETEVSVLKRACDALKRQIRIDQDNANLFNHDIYTAEKLLLQFDGKHIT